MDIVMSQKTKHWDWRSVVFAVVAGLFALLIVPGGLLSLPAPWLPTGAAVPGYTPEIHRWHDGEWGALMGILFGGSVLAALWRPRSKPLLVQFVVLGVGTLALVGALFDASLLIFLALVLLVGAVYPAPRTLLRIRRDEPMSRGLLAITGLAAVPLAAYAWRNLLLQFADASSEHAAQLHWVHGTIISIVLVLAGLLAASKRPGWQALGTIAGLALLYLGVAAISVPHHEGSWGTMGGAVAILAGVGFIAATLSEARSRQPLQRVASLRQSTVWLTRAALIGPSVWLAAIGALHLLRPYDLERYGDTLSAYGVGPYGILFTLAFVALGLGAIALAILLRRSLRRSIESGAGVLLVALAGVGLSLVGIFPMATDLASIEPSMRGDIPPTTSAIIHGLGGLSGMVFLMTATLLLSRVFRQDARWRPWWRVSLALSLVALALFAAGFFFDTPPVVPCCAPGSGAWVKALLTRGFFGALAAWLLLTTLRVRSVMAR
jgi:hypothetical protein